MIASIRQVGNNCPKSRIPLMPVPWHALLRRGKLCIFEMKTEIS
ncbi:hypothetical protein DSTSK_15980 [Desulforhabdus sp. TSK]|nr:hypothetical protein DSTSK_15980 [Desulforhabdus sp. TSK]